MRWLKQWKCGLSCDSGFGGDDITFSPEFDELRLEVEKGASIHAVGATDWEKVLSLASFLLENTTKDLWVFAYGCRATMAQGGVEWLAAALRVLADFLEQHWDELHPATNRKNRRAAPLNWLATQLEILLPADNFPHVEEEARNTFLDALHRIQCVVTEKLGEDAPSFNAVIRAVKQREEAYPQDASVLQVKNAQPTAEVPSMPEVLAGLNSSGHVADAVLPQLLRTTTEQAQQLAAHYISLDPTDWRIYLLHRTALWSTILQLPQANSEGVTQLRPMPRDRALSYEAAVSGGQYAAVLPQLERSAGRAPFWFDGHRLVFLCLDALKADKAKNIIASALNALLCLFPALTSLKYYDETPFAAPETKQWIDGLQQKQHMKKGSEAPWIPSAANDAFGTFDAEESLLREAVSRAKKENFDAGFSLLSTHSAGGRSRKAIKTAVLQARFCLSVGRTDSARYLLQAAYEKLERWGLLEWEPELSAQIVTLLVSTGRGTPGKDMDPMLKILHWLHLDSAFKVFPA
ncbi:MAG: type VI secretion system protein TssA [Desulfovibrio sp.]|nr:type VI secretion system protein TssA [Desulfovibrio sp.]